MQRSWKEEAVRNQNYELAGELKAEDRNLCTEMLEIPLNGLIYNLQPYLPIAWTCQLQLHDEEAGLRAKIKSIISESKASLADDEDDEAG